MRGILILSMLIGSLAFAGANAQTLTSVTLSWTLSSSPNVAGYDIYYGASSGNYITYVRVFSPTTTSLTINGLVSGATYYFAAASYDNSGNESALSPEISGVAGSSSPVAIRMSSLARPSAGQFGFTISGASSGQYIVQASTNLVNWVNLMTNNGPFNFVDSNAGQFSHRFYRTAYIPPN